MLDFRGVCTVSVSSRQIWEQKLLSKKKTSFRQEKSRLGAFRWHIFGHLGLRQIHPTKMEGMTGSDHLRWPGWHIAITKVHYVLTNYATWHADIHQITYHTLSSPPLHPLPSQDDLAWHNKYTCKNDQKRFHKLLELAVGCLRLVDQFQERKHKAASSFTSICLGKRKAAAACRRSCPRLVLFVHRGAEKNLFAKREWFQRSVVKVKRPFLSLSRSSQNSTLHISTWWLNQSKLKNISQIWIISPGRDGNKPIFKVSPPRSAA